ncbi:hypothetical protein [Cyanobium sp. CH-040]|nr:hypothetical protein [Cyanobium sp. CH-040]
MPPVSRETRTKPFLDVVLQHDVITGVQQLAREKVVPLMRLR